MSTFNPDKFIETRPVLTDEFLDLGLLPGIDMDESNTYIPSDEDVLRDALVLAQHEIDEAERCTLGDDYSTFSASSTSSHKYLNAEKHIIQRMRRSRVAIIGFGVLASLSLVKSGFNIEDSNYFSMENAPASLAYGEFQDCYEEPAKTLLALRGEWREVEVGDDSSVANCLNETARKIDDDIEQNRDSELVRESVTGYESFAEDLRVLAEAPGDAAPQDLIDTQTALKDIISSNEKHIFGEGMTAILMMLIGTVLAAPALSILEKYTERRRALKLLRTLRAYGYNAADVEKAIKEDISKSNKQTNTALAHRLTPIGSDFEREIELLPPKQGKKAKDSKFHSRRSSLSELRDALKSSK